MSKLMVSVSGIRGIVGDTLTPDIISRYASAFAKIVGTENILIARDSRRTGEMVENLVIGTLLGLGCKVTRLGIVPTPTAEMMVIKKRAAGAIVITASHNPQEWNALKFIGSDGMFLRKSDLQKLNDYYVANNFTYAKWEQIYPVANDFDSIPYHINKILSLKYINVAQIKKHKFRVVLDTNHGAGGFIGKELLRLLGCDVVMLGLETNGCFLHECEPIPANLKDLCYSVKQENADVGFAVDPDGDRVAIVSEKGVAIGEEYTLAIAVKTILDKKKGPITLNLSTSRMAEDIAATHGCKTTRTAVGEINVSSAMKENNSVIGGEGNGGTILPEVLYGRDAFIGIALTLQHLCETGKKVSEVVLDIPNFYMIKDKVELGNINPESVLDIIEKKLVQGKTNKEDGLRIDWDNGWVHIRKSNTEPIIRIIAEFKEKSDADNIINEIRVILKES